MSYDICIVGSAVGMLETEISQVIQPPGTGWEVQDKLAAKAVTRGMCKIAK